MSARPTPCYPAFLAPPRAGVWGDGSASPASHGPEGQTDTSLGRATRAGVAEVFSAVGTWGVREGFPGEVRRP